MQKIVVGIFILLMLGGSLCWGGEVDTVGGSGANAFATIADGVAQLHPGDTLRIMPGTYHEGISIPCDNVTVCGMGPDVVLDGTTSLTTGNLQSAPGRAGVFTWTFPDDASVLTPWVFYGDQLLICREKPLGSAKDQMCFYINKTQRQLEININGKDLPADADIQVPTIENLVAINGHRNVTIRGLMLRRAAQCGVSAGDSVAELAAQQVTPGHIEEDSPDLTVEYCYITQAGAAGISGGAHSLIAHNTITLCDTNATWDGYYDPGCCIEENLAVSNNICWEPGEPWAGNFKQNSGSYCTYRQNWAMDYLAGPVHVGPQTRVFTNNASTGFWCDIDCLNNTYEGNAVARLNNSGIYIELTASRNVVLYNAVQDCDRGITMRESNENLITRNWVWDHQRFGGTVDTTRYASHPCIDEQGKRVMWWDHLGWQDENAFNCRQTLDGLNLCDSNEPNDYPAKDNAFTHNLIQVSGAAVSVPFGCYGTSADWPTPAARKQLPPPPPFSNQLNDNYYDRADHSPFFALLGTKVMKSWKDYRAATDWDTTSHLGHFTPAVIGLTPLWTLPWAATKPNIPVAILYDPSLETPADLVPGEPLFWRGTDVKPSWILDAPISRYLKDGVNEANAHTGRRYITATNTPGATRECGWNSATIPVTPGTTMGVSLCAKAAAIVAAKPGTGVLATIRFMDVLGNPVGEKTLIGADGNAQLQTGSYPWTQVSGQPVVPAHAAWMQVFIGVQPSSGTVSFDDITINLVNPAPTL
jgi:hypothetical protein